MTNQYKIIVGDIIDKSISIQYCCKKVPYKFWNTLYNIFDTQYLKSGILNSFHEKIVKKYHILNKN